MKDILNTVP